MSGKNPISLLQELAMKNKGQLPQYDITSVGTVEVPRFKCTVKTSKITAEAEARNKKDAKQKAAENALELLGLKLSVISLNEPVQVKPIETLPQGYNAHINYIGLLNEYASGHQLDYPVYEDAIFPENGQFKFVCRFMKLLTEGFAPNKKEAKRLSAFKMLECLKDIPIESTMDPIKKPPKPIIEINSNDEIIMRKYEKLSINTSNRSYVEDGFLNIRPHPQIEKKEYSIEEARKILLSLGYTIKTKTIQEGPFIVAVQLAGKEFTLMGFGDTQDEAEKKVLNDSLDIIRDGCSAFIPDTHLPLTLKN